MSASSTPGPSNPPPPSNPAPSNVVTQRSEDTYRVQPVENQVPAPRTAPPQNYRIEKGMS